MAVTSTVGRRFGAFPHWLSTFGIVVGGVLGLTGSFIGPFDFLFPLWLLVVSVTLGRRSRRYSGSAVMAQRSTGGLISRLRILPVGPLGSSSSNHTWRGYL